MYLGFVQFSLPKLFTSLSPIYFILLITFYSPSNLQSLPKKFPSDCIAGHLLVLSGMFLLLGLRFPSYNCSTLCCHWNELCTSQNLFCSLEMLHSFLVVPTSFHGVRAQAHIPNFSIAISWISSLDLIWASVADSKASVQFFGFGDLCELGPGGDVYFNARWRKNIWAPSGQWEPHTQPHCTALWHKTDPSPFLSSSWPMNVCGAGHAVLPSHPWHFKGSF